MTTGRTNEIRVCGQLGETALVAFSGMRSHTAQGQTLLRGHLTDQSAVYGLLAQSGALGLELVEIRRG